jgi:hypothetical protein
MAFREKLGEHQARLSQHKGLQMGHFWAVSSVGRAPARQAGGHWFEPSTAHHGKASQIEAFRFLARKRLAGLGRNLAAADAADKPGVGSAEPL